MKRTSGEAVSFGFNGTPSFAVTGPNGTKALGTPRPLGGPVRGRDLPGRLRLRR